ncbi:MAG: glutamate--tRNA ligase family protein [Nanoarchaeota archaeon]|nr:glutamate--tRNA ligase family protein [Nanoarchaeota archaeon]
MDLKKLQKLARAYALKNAIAYNGKAQTGSVISSLFHEGLKPEEVKKNIKEINKIISEVNSLSLEEQEEEFGTLKKGVSERKGREGLAELPDVKKGKVIMRFAPSPSGPFHVGHALTACLSFLYVEKYKGKFYVRIEDTNPENIYKPAYKMIEQESKWLFKNKAKIVIQSDRMKNYYKCAEKLIKKNAAYVCSCSSEKFKKFSDFKEDCPCRNNDLKENLYRWKKMLKDAEEGEFVLRFKSFNGMKDQNPAMRDFPLARINLTKHPRQGKKYHVWPLMNLSVTADDIEMKITHIIRGKDHLDNAKRQKMIYEALGEKKKIPWTGFLGRIKFTDLELSSTKIREAIEKGKFKGWDDEKLPTIASLKKRGYKPEAFYKFAERVGISENDKVMNKEEFYILLNSFNKIT